MSVDARISDGQITNHRTTSTNTKGVKQDEVVKDGSKMDKDAFLQLLVAQMKYQDPMEPTDNTEYVAQLAQFSSLEAMNNMGDTMNLQNATSLVGKVVTVATMNETTGVMTETTGTVESVNKSGTKVYLMIDGNQYEMDDVREVLDSEYAKATTLAEAWRESYSKLPKLGTITKENGGNYLDRIQSLATMINNMSSYQQSFIPDEEKQSFAEYIVRMRDLGFKIDA